MAGTGVNLVALSRTRVQMGRAARLTQTATPTSLSLPHLSVPLPLLLPPSHHCQNHNKLRGKASEGGRGKGIWEWGRVGGIAGND